METESKAFLYFVPMRTALGEAEAAELGVGPADIVLSRSVPCPAGPGGSSGVMLGASSPDNKPALRYVADAQTWVPGPDKAWWVGFETTSPPGPDDLARKNMIPGLEVTLDDGNAWLVPVARRFLLHEGQGHTLPAADMPQVFGVDEDGEDMMEVAPRAQPLWKAANEYWNATHGSEEEDPKGVTLGQLFEIAADVLAANYKVGPREIRALRLLSTDSATAINEVANDLSGYVDILQEMAGEESSAEGNVDTSTGSSG